MDKVWTEGPRAHEGELCPECKKERLVFVQYQQREGGPVTEIYFCHYCDDHIYFYP